jgi:hypothetical protein
MSRQPTVFNERDRGQDGPSMAPWTPSEARPQKGLLGDRLAEQQEADRRHDQRDDRNSGPDHSRHRQHQSDDADRAGHSAGHDEAVGPLLARTARRIASPFLDIGHYNGAYRT